MIECNIFYNVQISSQLSQFVIVTDIINITWMNNRAIHSTTTTSYTTNCKSIDGLCVLEIEADINPLTVYAEESFYDFILQRSNCLCSCSNLLSSTMHCGNFNNINHQCN